MFTLIVLFDCYFNVFIQKASVISLQILKYRPTIKKYVDGQNKELTKWIVQSKYIIRMHNMMFQNTIIA